MHEIEKFFHEVTPIILNYLLTASRKIEILKVNTPTKVEFATVADIGVEKILAVEINKRFPSHKIIAEETTPDVPNDVKGYYWIIDPICGTTNFSRGSQLFATNFALAKDGDLIAGCVIDHIEDTYIWSTGGRKVYKADKLQPSLPELTHPYIIDFDFPILNSLNDKEKKKFNNFLGKINKSTNYYVTCYATSLSWTYTALGKIDAFIVPKTRATDAAAPVFITQQSGGIVTQINGKPWTIRDESILASRDSSLHKTLLSLLNK